MTEKDLAQLNEACKQYVLASDDGYDILFDFARKTGDRVRQRMADSGVSRDIAYRDIAVDWMSDNKGELERRELKAVLIACWWFTKLLDDDIGLPSVVRDNISQADVQEYVKYLNEQTRRKRDAKKNARHDKGGGAAP